MKTFVLLGLTGMAIAGVAWLGLPCTSSCSLALGSPAIAATESNPVAEGDLKPGEARVVIPVKGMTCGGCSAAINRAVKKLDGVVEVAADHEKGTATVTYLKDKVTVERIVEAINKTGFKAVLPEGRKDS